MKSIGCIFFNICKFLVYDFQVAVWFPPNEVSRAVSFFTRYEFDMTVFVGTHLFYYCYSSFSSQFFLVFMALLLVTSGAAFGTVITVLASPPMIAHYEWPVVFYFFGALGCAFTVIWHLVVFDTPADHATISTQEVSGGVGLFCYYETLKVSGKTLNCGLIVILENTFWHFVAA